MALPPLTDGGSEITQGKPLGRPTVESQTNHIDFLPSSPMPQAKTQDPGQRKPDHFQRTRTRDGPVRLLKGTNSTYAMIHGSVGLPFQTVPLAKEIPTANTPVARLQRPFLEWRFSTGRWVGSWGTFAQPQASLPLALLNQNSKG